MWHLKALSGSWLGSLWPGCSSSSMCLWDFSSCLRAEQEAAPDPGHICSGVEFWRKSSGPTAAAQPRVWIQSPNPVAAQISAWHCTCMSLVAQIPFTKNSSHNSLKVRDSWQCSNSCYSFILKHFKVFSLFITLWRRLELKINLKGLQLRKSCTKSLYQIIVCFLSGLSIIEVKIIYSSNPSAIEFRSIYSLQH